MSYVYLIQSNEFYKIGIANDLKTRLAQLQTGNPTELLILACYEFPNAQAVEIALHQKYKNVRKRGEWFMLTEQDQKDFNQICNMLGGELYFPNKFVANYEDEQEAEQIAEPVDGAKFDYAAMFSDGWIMERANSKGWRWRNTKPAKDIPLNSSSIFIYGGLVKDLPYSIDEMQKRFNKKP